MINYACSICSEQNTRYGIKVEAIKRGSRNVATELYLCRRCANRILPIFTEAMDKADEEIDRIIAERKEE